MYVVNFLQTDQPASCTARLPRPASPCRRRRARQYPAIPPVPGVAVLWRPSRGGAWRRKPECRCRAQWEKLLQSSIKSYWCKYSEVPIRSTECISMGVAGAWTRRSLGHNLLHPRILRLNVLLAPANFEAHLSLLFTGAIGGKTSKTAVLPWFCKIKHGCDSGGAQRAAMLLWS